MFNTDLKNIASLRGFLKNILGVIKNYIKICWLSGSDKEGGMISGVSVVT
jgi:hypothetical protein